MSCGVGRRRLRSGIAMWCRLAAVAPNQPLAWELPHASGAALKSKEKKKKKKRERERESLVSTIFDPSLTAKPTPIPMPSSASKQHESSLAP